jgi:hypothetical protein
VAAKERERKRKKFWTLTRHDECQFCPQLAWIVACPQRFTFSAVAYGHIQIA